MVFPGEHCRIATSTRVRNMRGRTEQGAVLHLPAIRLGRHHVRIYTTNARCAIYGELQRKCSHASKQTERLKPAQMLQLLTVIAMQREASLILTVPVRKHGQVHGAISLTRFLQVLPSIGSAPQPKSFIIMSAALTAPNTAVSKHKEGH